MADSSTRFVHKNREVRFDVCTVGNGMHVVDADVGCRVGLRDDLGSFQQGRRAPVKWTSNAMDSLAHKDGEML